MLFGCTSDGVGTGADFGCSAVVTPGTECESDGDEYDLCAGGFDAVDDYGWGYAAGEFAGRADSDICLAMVGCDRGSDCNGNQRG